MIACHKPYDGYRDDVYTPIHVGRAISRFKEEMADMIGDDTGDNISNRNPYYSELTAQYWAWKNLHNVEYIGFCHYHRFFNFKVSNDNIDNIMKNHDVVLLNYQLHTLVEQAILRPVDIEDLIIFMMVLKKKYPDFEKTVIDYLWNIQVYPRNMLICKKSLFDEYASWIFDILFECEKYIRHSPYNRGKRTFAYLGEFFMAVFMLHKKCRIKKAKYVEAIDEKSNWNLLNDLYGKLKLLYFKPLVRLEKPKYFEDYYFPEVLLGFKNDGINPMEK